MNFELTLVFAAILAFAGLVGCLVKAHLDRRSRLSAVAGDDEILVRAAETDVGMPECLARIVRRKRSQQVRAELPDAMDMIANSLTAGLTLPQALMRNIDHFSPLVQAEFARVIYDTRLGFSVAGAFENFSNRLGLNDAKMIAIASQIGVEHGGNLADSYRMLSALLRDNLAFEMELRAMTTEGRMQALVMSCLPFALLLVLSLISWELVGPLFTTVAGWCVLGGLCVMLAAAYFWIRKIVDIEV